MIMYMKYLNQTGVMTSFVVIDSDGEQVGYGYVVWKDGSMGHPTLFSNDGGALEANMYTLLAVEQQLVVLPKAIQ